MFIFRKTRCTHQNNIWIRRKKKLIRKCARCGYRIRYGEKVLLSD